MKIELRILAAGLALAAGAAGAATAQDFTGGKNMRIVIGSSAGGGFDAFGRMVGRHLGAEIPGRPNIVVSNLPGAGSLKAVQSVKVQPADGTYMVLFNPGLVVNSLLQPKKVKFDFTKDVQFVGSATADARVCHAWHATGVKTMADLLKKVRFNTGHTGTSSATYIDAAMLKNLFGAKIKQIVGYPGATEQRLAVERGELDGDCGSYDSVPQNWITDKKTNVFIRISRVSVPELKDVPHIADFANDEQKKIITLLTTHNLMFRPFIVSRKVPADRLAVLREAFWKTVNGKAFLAEAARSKRAVIEPLRGQDVEKLVAEMYATPAALLPKAAAAAK